VVEKENQVASHQSSRNSGVIHSGIYYRPDSLRALNCRRGYALLLSFCREQGLPFDVCGKIIVAATEAERAPLDQIFRRGQENGLAGLRKIGPAEAQAIEPHVRAVEAVWVPQAGITDYGAVARKYAELIGLAGGTLVLGQRVTGIFSENVAMRVETTAGEHQARVVVNCGGLYSDHLATLSGETPGVQILPFRGEYYELKHEREGLVRNLIYPVPNPNFPFLGVHFTRMIQGGIEAGPNAVLAFRREGYSRWDLHLPELAETLRFPGFQRLARRYWRDGWAEMQRSYVKARFVKALQHLVPDIRSEDLVPGRSGVRAMACLPDGRLHDDFLILEKPRLINVCNAPSPAATASLAIGETIAQRVLRQLA
ncbi:MAG: L-2-hydroxyglutarate oxidase, partial [Saprospiraceae bacterium]|nr:L-2-hydroxyglutarate oxidase [Saprospiraceae bacterium]